MEPVEDPAAGVDEIEAPSLELERQLVHVGLEKERVRHSFARDRGRLAGDVDTGDECSELGELSGRLAGCTLQVENVSSFQFGQPLADRLRNSELPGHRVGAAAVDLVPGQPVVL